MRLTVSNTADMRIRNVSVYGHRYSDSAGSVEAKAAPSTVKGGKAEDPVKVSPTSVVEVWVERLDPALGEDFGWSPEPQAIVASAGFRRPTKSSITRRVLAEETLAAAKTDTTIQGQLIDPILFWPVLWNGTVTLPPGRLPTGTRYRLVVAEYEEYLVDDVTPYDKTPSAKDRRIVSMEHVELT